MPSSSYHGIASSPGPTQKSGRVGPGDEANHGKVRGPNLGHFLSFCLPINGTSLGKLHNRPVRILQASYFLHSKFEVQSHQDSRERSDFVHVIHVANFWGVVPNSGHFHKLTESTQDCLFEVPEGLKTFSSTHGGF